MKQKIKKKSDLNRDSVQSSGFHVGIELELFSKTASSEHDEESCSESRRASHRDYLECMDLRELLEVCRGVTFNSDQVSALESYIDRNQIIEDEMDHFASYSECDDSDCGYYFGLDRRQIERDLLDITKNTSVKVVEDSSIDSPDSGSDAEVCWNYFASKETIKDNSKILGYLKDNGFSFNKSCGLHINLNNYLNIPKIEIDTAHFDFLFNLVAPSRRKSTFCNNKAMSATQKYSMVYHQGDRLEFRFFSPTLESEKLNHYVVVAKTIYNRLAGKNSKLPKRTYSYMYNKMISVNGINETFAAATLDSVNLIKSARSYMHKKIDDNENETSEVA